MEPAAEDLQKALEKLLNGEGLQVTELDSVSDQPQAVTLRKTVCYIVSAVIFNAKGEVLMVQEAKRECYRRWYLPAGRMEVGESIHEALRREVKEEAGLECEPITMLLVQEQGQRWIRFTFLAKMTGGSLKTTSEADSESLQAQWWDRQAPLPLRSRDILSLIEAGLRYQRKPWFPACHPVALPCPVVCLRLILVFVSADSEDTGEGLWLMLTNHEVESKTGFPVIVSGDAHTVTWPVHKLVQDCPLPSCHFNTRGILGVQHDGRVQGQTDGICFNTLITLEHAEEGATLDPPPLDSEKYTWYKVTNQSLAKNIRRRIKDGSLLPLQSL